MDERRPVIVVYLDFDKTFSTVSYSTLTNTRMKCGLDKWGGLKTPATSVGSWQTGSLICVLLLFLWPRECCQGKSFNNRVLESRTRGRPQLLAEPPTEKYLPGVPHLSSADPPSPCSSTQTLTTKSQAPYGPYVLPLVFGPSDRWWHFICWQSNPIATPW